MDALSGDLAFLPLGGTGEIGMNLNLYRCDDKWLAVDCGIGFGGSAAPEVKILLPDPAFISERRDKLLGLVITHAHEDHIGAVAHLWRGLRCPVYSTPFAAAVLRRKLSEARLLSEVRLHVISPGGKIELPPFSLQFIPMPHSLPEAQALVIRTSHGIVLHTGDWKFDLAPLIGAAANEAALAELGSEGVLALVCDSTNAMVEGHSGSEGEVRTGLSELIRGLPGRVAVTCFASNVARIESIAFAARDSGRRIALVGRSLRNMVATARECGYLKQIPEFVPEDEVGTIPDEDLLILVTGSQGEERSALARVAADTHPSVSLGAGDTVIFSSRVIPGNERIIAAVQDNLVRRGVQVLTDEDHLVHVSGHPARDELRHLYRLIQPRFAVPVHGEWRHLAAHAALAKDVGATPILLENGDILSLYPGQPKIIDSAPVGRLALDGNRLVPMKGAVLAARRRMLFNGVVLGSVAVDADGRLVGLPRVSAPGLFEPDDPEALRVVSEFCESMASLPAPLRRNDESLADAALAALRRALGRRLQKHPLVNVHLLRV